MSDSEVYALFEGRPRTEREYGCVRCQKWHRESDGPIFEEHILWQSKHGIRRAPVEGAFDTYYVGEVRRHVH